MDRENGFVQDLEKRFFFQTCRFHSTLLDLKELKGIWLFKSRAGKIENWPKSTKCVERQSQGPSPAAPVVDQGHQVHSPLLLPPLNQLAQLRAAGAHGENAENAQEEAAQGLRMLDQRRITAAIMKLWAPHVEARTLGPPHHRGQVMHPRQLSLTIP